ncbi:efflux RND transporter periplasmic adaptor subunit [Ammoniphilus sp. CFH 90114]|uniref:efflux RND transporter periplasmic adaptor subunit n=1 Tax=Ammoniphilus sp. CFH 90114 TaxID=2493665 RepID=UPI00100FA9F5|nr:efflux RND transporter periplasmic adaptor subunit [Ammoniphilus sp. CFH 90114]RXT15425.1 efflux RND transporter periplasmic adaptor subunit [Ammoniphilus sp. CFH 90114]
MKKNQLVLLTVSFLLITGCSSGGPQGSMGAARGQGGFGQAQQTVAVEVEPVAKGDLTVTKKILGNVVSDSVSEVSSGISGELISLQVKKGDRVQKGQILATVDISDTQEAITQSEMEIESAKQQLENAQISKKQAQQKARDLQQAETDWDKAKEELEEAQYLYEQGAIALAELKAAQTLEEERKTAYENQEASLEIEMEKADLSIRQNELSVKKAEINLQQTLKDVRDTQSDGVIRAPISGEVMAVNYKVGENVSSQQPLVTISNNQQLIITAQVTAEQKALLPKGREVNVETVAESKTLKAKVDYVSGATNENGLFDVELTFATSDTSVASGEVVQLTFTETLVENALLVPTKAILQEGDSRIVYTAEGGKAVKRKVEIINSQTHLTAVQGDLQENTQLIVNGHKLVSDGMTILLPGQELPAVGGGPGEGENAQGQAGEGQRRQGPSGTGGGGRS